MIRVVGNLKGGTGKSTLAFNLSVWAAEKVKDVVLFDLDPQKTLTDVVEVRCEEEFHPRLPIPLSAEDLSKSDWRSAKHVVMDVSASDMGALEIAVSMADQLILPVAPSQADIWSTQRFLKKIEPLIPSHCQIYGVMNRADTHHLVVETQEAEEAMDTLGRLERVPQRLYQRTAYRRSFSEGLAVFEMPGADKARNEFLALAKWLDRRAKKA